MFRQFAADDRDLSRVGLFFCLALSAVVFFVAVRALPIKQGLPQMGGTLHTGASPSPKIIVATPTAVAAVVSSAPTAAPPVSTPISQAAVVAPVSSPKPPAVIPSASASPIAAADPKVYTVQAGDTLYGIARNHGGTPQAIAALNGMSGTTILKAGQRLLLP